MHAVDHINLVVDDLEAMLRFYETVLGLKLSNGVTISGEWIDRTVGLNDVQADVAYLDRETGPRIELIRYLLPYHHEPKPP